MIIPEIQLVTVKDYKEWLEKQDESQLVGIALLNSGIPTIAVLSEEELQKMNSNTVHDGRKEKKKNLAICKRSN